MPLQPPPRPHPPRQRQLDDGPPVESRSSLRQRCAPVTYMPPIRRSSFLEIVPATAAFALLLQVPGRAVIFPVPRRARSDARSRASKRAAPSTSAATVFQRLYRARDLSSGRATAGREFRDGSAVQPPIARRVARGFQA